MPFPRPGEDIAGFLANPWLPVDSYLQWQKMRKSSPEGERLYQQTPGVGEMLLEGLREWWGNDSAELPTALQYPVSSLLGRYAMHMPYVADYGPQSPYGATLKHHGTDVAWLRDAVYGDDYGEGDRGQHTRPIDRPGVGVNLLSNAPEWPGQVAEHEASHGAVGRVKDRYPQRWQQAVAAVRDLAPRSMAALNRSPGYQGLPDDDLANEVVAYSAGSKQGAVPVVGPERTALQNHPVLEAIYRLAQQSQHPEMNRKPGEGLWRRFVEAW